MIGSGLRLLALSTVFCCLAPAAMAQSYRPSSSTGDFLTSADFDTLLTYGRENNVSVRERPRPEYEALGIRRGAFLIFPRLETGLGITDNILSSAADPESDTYVVFDPSVAIESQWSLHAANITGGIQHREVIDNNNESQTGGYLSFGGRYDAGTDLVFSGDGGFVRSFEDRTSTNSPQDISESIEVSQLNAGLRVTKEAGRVRLLGSVDAASLDYKDVDTFSGFNVDQDYRDQTLVRYTGRGEAALSPDTSAFAVLNYTSTSYDQGGVNDRSSDEIRALFGGNFDITALVRGEVGLGYISRDYSRASFDQLEGVAVLARIEYFPTELLTVAGQFRRAIDDSAVGGAGGFFVTDATITADYELLRNVILTGRTTYRREEFEGIDRSDELWEVALGAQYLVTRTVGIGATASYLDRSSEGAFAGSSFDATRLMVTLVVQR